MNKFFSSLWDKNASSYKYANLFALIRCPDVRSSVALYIQLVLHLIGYYYRIMSFVKSYSVMIKMDDNF